MPLACRPVIAQLLDYLRANSQYDVDAAVAARSVVLVSLIADAACVFGATAGFSEDTPPPRVRGTLDQVNGNMLTIKTRSGTPTTVELKDGAPVIATVKGSMSDIQDNSFVGITAMPQPDGTIKAVEVHVFAEPLRGIGEGHYPWDLMPNSSMTNAAVTQQVKKAEGNTLMLKYKDGEKTIVVPFDATVVQFADDWRAGDGEQIERHSADAQSPHGGF